MIELLVRNRDGSIEGQVGVFSELSTATRFNGVGSWALKFPVTDIGLKLATKGRSLIARRDYGEGDVRTIISGPFWQRRESLEGNDNEIVLSGFSDSIRLWDLMAIPCDPLGWSGTTQFPFQATDMRRGVAESVIKAFVAYNALHPARQVPGVQPLTIADDRGIGSFIVESPRFDNLGDLLVSAAIHGGRLGFDVVADLDESEIAPIVFDVYQPVDRTSEAVFSVESGNIASCEVTTTAPTATRVIVAGQGEGTERKFVIVSNDELAEEWGRHVEVFVDQRQTDDETELYQKGMEVLADKSGKTEFSFQALDVPHRTAGRHYGVGDIVTTQGIPGVLSEIKRTYNGNGETVTPFTSDGVGVTEKALLGAFEAIRALRKRVNPLERYL